MRGAKWSKRNGRDRRPSRLVWFPTVMAIDGTDEEHDWQPIWPTVEGSDDPVVRWKTPWPPMAPMARKKCQRSSTNSHLITAAWTRPFSVVRQHSG